MKTVEATFGRWYIQCLPEDGARISVLKYDGQDLLTPTPSEFSAPAVSYGEYETRPVYGYDDCFPTVDPCDYPGGQFKCRDHGELCWQDWLVEIKDNKLICTTNCKNPETSFTRILEFTDKKLKWKFKVSNPSDKKLPFLHIMHPLMPLQEIKSIKLPGFGKITEEITSFEPDINNPSELATYLLSIPSGKSEMLILSKIREGSLFLSFKNGMSVNVSFDINIFPSLGIWWNNNGYPDEAGLRRNECAFEPIPGTCSDLSRSFIEGTYLSAEPEKGFNWEIFWEIE